MDTKTEHGTEEQNDESHDEDSVTTELTISLVSRGFGSHTRLDDI
jgi:hypothetical protein